ncbi:MAG: YitT family protein [Bacillota bacterium]|uniref:YitT family protein n=1 Tax=Allobaculum stercoricanis TaxID=174709 RepID=UPI00248D4E23|nr:YitT family protein [Allobaculum stercoricanis]MDO5347340.1 YitT family protein [Bacillota bacterium]
MINRVKEILIIFLGNLCVGAGVSLFVLPNNILTGGVAGVAVALEPIIPLDPVLVINVLTIGLYIVGAIVLGKEFAIKSFLSTIFYPMSVTGLAMIIQMLPQEIFIMPDWLAAIGSGVLIGLGLGLVFIVDASTGGLDIPALILSKYLKIKSGDAMAFVDGLVVLLGIFTYGFVPALIGIVSVFVMGQAINKTVLFNTQQAKNLLIISDQWQQIKTYLINTIDRGVTILEGQGGYTNEKRPVLMCVVSQKQLSKIESNIIHIDPCAFMVIHDVNQVQGEGFTFLNHERGGLENEEHAKRIS